MVVFSGAKCNDMDGDGKMTVGFDAGNKEMVAMRRLCVQNSRTRREECRLFGEAAKA